MASEILFLHTLYGFGKPLIQIHESHNCSNHAAKVLLHLIYPQFGNLNLRYFQIIFHLTQMNLFLSEIVISKV